MKPDEFSFTISSIMENQGSLPSTKVPRYFSLPQSSTVPSSNENYNSRPVGLQVRRGIGFL